MNRADKFEKSKITKVSTNKTVTNVYFDAFGIEKVRIQNASYETKQSIDAYVDFAQIALWAEDLSSGRMIQQLRNAGKPITMHMGGSKSSKNYNGAPESRIMTFGIVSGERGEKVFINMSEGKGKLGPTGLIIPDGAPTKKISVGMDIDDFRRMFIFTRDCVNAYLTNLIPNLVYEVEQDRINNMNNM